MSLDGGSFRVAWKTTQTRGKRANSTQPSSSLSTFWLYARDANFLFVVIHHRFMKHRVFVTGSAGFRQPCPRGCGAVEGHDGSPRESGGSVAQAEPSLNSFSPTCITLLCCSSSCAGLLSQLSDHCPVHWQLTTTESWVLWETCRVPMVSCNEGFEQSIGAEKHFYGFLCRNNI